ncbi:MAG TPA: metal-sensing transcriptional repressor [Candidatus Scatavimonas merdigallinarum]|uniref:Metal-sensing transcriptional repressor n=1 Tax=Candidatus Scatavimonas merdigallinarum TaxID=2840914 RepID=A0A9D0ZFV6_9FIRM|nr:metal-sensing transcriptional repressor [Candidatus Scatavimonas merdigallinarum]
MQNRLKRMTGQLNGIANMLEDNRYCGDILIQVSAVQSALQAFAYLLLQNHMETCVVEEIQKGNMQVISEAVELIKQLK